MTQTSQLGFADLLDTAHTANVQRRFDRATAHLPGTMEEGVPCHRLQIRQHHAAMLAADLQAAMRIRKEAGQLARKLNHGDPGILAHDDAPGYALPRACAAPDGAVPLWGQQGAFIIEAAGLRARVEMDGMFGIGCTAMSFPGFAVRAVDPDRPFLSETGYHSFLGIRAEPVPGMSVDEFVREVVTAHVRRELKGQLKVVRPVYRGE